MLFHFKRIIYRKLDKFTSVPKGKVVLDEKDFTQIRDYIILLEGELHRTNRQRTFADIPTELKNIFGIEKYNQMYGKNEQMK